MTKKILCLVMAVMMLAGTTVFACDTTEDLPIGYYNIVYANRYLFFATDGGSTFRPLELPRGTKVNLNDYIPTKEGYEFKYWSYNEEGSSRFSFYSNITSDLNLLKRFVVSQISDVIDLENGKKLCKDCYMPYSRFDI